MTEEQEKKLEDTLNAEFEKIRTDSLIRGARMVASACLALAVSKKKPYNQRLNQIASFCNQVLMKTEAQAEKLGIDLSKEPDEDEVEE